MRSSPSSRAGAESRRAPSFSDGERDASALLSSRHAASRHHGRHAAVLGGLPPRPARDPALHGVPHLPPPAGARVLAVPELRARVGPGLGTRHDLHPCDRASRLPARTRLARALHGHRRDPRRRSRCPPRLEPRRRAARDRPARRGGLRGGESRSDGTAVPGAESVSRPDAAALARERYGRVQAAMARQNVGTLLLATPHLALFASGARRVQVAGSGGAVPTAAHLVAAFGENMAAARCGFPLAEGLVWRASSRFTRLAPGEPFSPGELLALEFGVYLDGHAGVAGGSVVCDGSPPSALRRRWF